MAFERGCRVEDCDLNMDISHEFMAVSAVFLLNVGVDRWGTQAIDLGWYAPPRQGGMAGLSGGLEEFGGAVSEGF